MMPRSLDDLIAHADELADQFENFEPQPGAEDRPLPPAIALQIAVLRRAAAERELAEAVRAAREADISWRAVGKTIGTSGEAARQRYRAIAS